MTEVVPNAVAADFHERNPAALRSPLRQSLNRKSGELGDIGRREQPIKSRTLGAVVPFSAFALGGRSHNLRNNFVLLNLFFALEPLETLDRPFLHGFRQKSFPLEWNSLSPRKSRYQPLFTHFLASLAFQWRKICFETGCEVFKLITSELSVFVPQLSRRNFEWPQHARQPYD